MSLSPEDIRLIGGSDVAAIVGRDPYKSAIDVWQRIQTGKEPEVTPEQAKRMRRGTLLEPVISSMAADEFGLVYRGPWSFRPKGDLPLRCSLDQVHAPKAEPGVEPCDAEVVEFKSVSPEAEHHWGPEGTDQVPVNYLLQVQWYLRHTGWSRGRLIPYFGGDDLRQYFILADLDLHNLLIEAVERFVRDHVLTGVPPPPDGSECYAEWIERRFPRRTGTLIQADEELARLAAEHREARDQAEAWDDRRKLLAQQIAMRLGEADGCEGYLADGQKWRITNRVGKGKPSLDWEALSLAFNLPGDARERFAKRTPSPVFTNKVLKPKKEKR